ncbi:MAG: nicotinamide-nucleotide amidase [Gammaproteobacteria bacterium]|nr:nicotinamide-nucleotide amidase [Gammaproteobacteria bacterium]
MSDKKLTIIVNKIALSLIKANKKLTVAESCTGGWVAKVLTDLAGSSEWFERGFVTYSNQAKHEMLGVKESTLESYGAVSQETVAAMAAGALKNSQADFSLSISGIAGPGGGSEDKPVGLVWFSWAVKENNKLKVFASEKRVFEGDRESVRYQSVEYVLSELIKILKKLTG